MFLMVSHQFAPMFNPVDLAALAADPNPIWAAYDIVSLRIWDQPSAMTPPTAEPNPGPLPPPQSGPDLGDLPALSSGTYVINVEVCILRFFFSFFFFSFLLILMQVVNGQIVDHFGNNVQLVDGAQIASGSLNGLDSVLVQTNGGISVTGSGIFWAQGGVSYTLMQVAGSHNPYLGTYGTYAQFIQVPHKHTKARKKFYLQNKIKQKNKQQKKETI
jgi:hypothetical protein